MHDITLLQLFSDDISASQQLLALIQDEFNALGERDLPQLEQILERKLPLLSLLEQHGRERSELLQSLQLSTDQKGLEELATRSQQGSDLLARSAQLSELLEQCRAANLLNGRVIRTSQTAANSVLSILRGTETPNLYDSRGSTARIAQQRPLSQA
jgi:flagella synthesis protein FlgN